jgi:uncharacterized protein YgbK (DUF1537 family)
MSEERSPISDQHASSARIAADQSLPDDFPDERLQQRVRAVVEESRRKVVALDDDPTGVQTVFDTPVLARWEIGDLKTELEAQNPLFYVLTNSRSLPEDEAAALNEEIVRNLQAAAAGTGVSFSVASRSDSTLRGHFPAETDAIARVLGGVDGVLICPAFFEGGRLTIDDIHYVRDGDRLIPAADTEFARDAVFGYRQSNLRFWIEEKTRGRIKAADVTSLSLEEIRTGGPEKVLERLNAVKNGQPVIVNAASYQDLYVVALAVIRAETSGQSFIYRTAASFVRARVGLPERPLLSRRDLLGINAPPYVPGLVIVGSHVRRSSEQLAKLLELQNTIGIEVRVPDVLKGGDPRARVISEAREAADQALAAGLTPVVFTSRQVVEGPAGRDPLAVSRAVSDALVEIVGAVERRPGFIVGKGGITSSDIGTRALGARRAIVLGQIVPGVPVWRLGPEARFPDLPYVVFPGNVGQAETLAELVTSLRAG